MLLLPVAVVTGATKRNVEMSCFSSSPSKRATSAPGSVVAAGAGGARRPCAALQNRLDAKSLCHHDAHRFSVRKLTPTISRNLWSRFADTVALSALNTTTTGPKNTLRPRNRTDGGVTRRRQPSRSQQKLCRHMMPVPISPGPPRGLRG